MGETGVRILLLCNGWQQAASQTTAHGIRHVQAYYLAREFDRYGCELFWGKLGPRGMTLAQSIEYYRVMELPEVDHCLCFEASGFFHRIFAQRDEVVYREPVKATRRIGLCPLLDRLRESVSGAIGILKDTPNIVGPEDITFFGTHFPPELLLMPQCVHLGVAADAEYFRPQQNSNVTVLVDHPHYTQNQADDTPMIVKSLRGSGAKVLRFGKQQVEEIDVEGVNAEERYYPGCSHAEVAAAHNRAHVFYTTHRESMGLAVIEAAMAGNLIVTKRSHIKPTMLEGLHCLVYDKDPPVWDTVLSAINPLKARTKAMRYDRWREMGWIVRNAFANWKNKHRLTGTTV